MMTDIFGGREIFTINYKTSTQHWNSPEEFYMLSSLAETLLYKDYSKHERDLKLSSLRLREELFVLWYFSLYQQAPEHLLRLISQDYMFQNFLTQIEIQVLYKLANALL